MRRVLPLAVLLAAVGCGKSDNEPGPGGVTVGEARALDEAAEMIEKGRLPGGAPQPEVLPSGMASAAP